jgi:hypothetical protein
MLQWEQVSLVRCKLNPYNEPENILPLLQRGHFDCKTARNRGVFVMETQNNKKKFKTIKNPS